MANTSKISAFDYSFGTILDGRKFGNFGRVGFNSKENDDEIKGVGNSQDYGMRIYDNRLGKFLSVDPLSINYAWNSTYAFAENRPIDGIDLDGEEFLSPMLDLYDKIIPVLEASNANKTVVYTMKVIRGMGNSTVEGQVRGVANQVKDSYNQIQAAKRDPKAAQQFVKDNLGETIKSSDQKMAEGMGKLIKGAFRGDPDAVGNVVGIVIQGAVFKGAMPKSSTPSGKGDLTIGETNQIQKVVNEAGRPLDVVGSAAKGIRKGVGLDGPILKGIKSDIDYTASQTSMPYFKGLKNTLPSLDAGGVFGGGANPNIGPSFNFSPGGATISTNGGTIGAAAVVGANSASNKEKK